MIQAERPKITMASSTYTNKTVDVSVKPDTTTLRGKSVVVTGGKRES